MEGKVDIKRRRFLEKTGKTAVVAPAVVLLMSANVKVASANTTSGNSTPTTTPFPTTTIDP